MAHSQSYPSTHNSTDATPPKMKAIGDPSDPSDPAQWQLALAITPADATCKLEAFFAAEGYTLESGTNANGVYAMGNKVLYFFFGSFITRYTFAIAVHAHDSGSRITLDKGMASVVDGVVGKAKMEHEQARVRTAAQSFFA